MACRHRPPVPYDRLSINIGSTPQLQGVPGADAFTTPVKPITRFNARWLALLARVQAHTQGLLRIAVVGAGAGGVELVLSMQYRLQQELQARGRSVALLQFHLLSEIPSRTREWILCNTTNFWPTITFHSILMVSTSSF